MRDQQSSSPIELFISSTEMASTTSANVNEILPGLESFLRSMLNSTNLDRDHRQIAAMYADKIDELSRPSNQPQQQETPIIDDQSFMNTMFVSDDESDDFTDEEEEERNKELAQQLQREQEQEQQLPPTGSRRTSSSDNQLYHSTRRKSNNGNSQWYIDVPKNTYLEALAPQSSYKHNGSLSSKAASRLSISTPSSTIIADGLLLTYDENHNWIWRYYVLDDFDLICFPADKKSLSTSQIQSDNDCSPLWVSDMTNAKVHTTVIDKIDCLCLQIGLAEAIYVRPSDPNQINHWLKAFRDATSSQKSKDNTKGRSNVKTLSRNARRMFAQFNRKKGQIVSHLLDQMANVTGVDEKTRKHCELRGFLVVSLDNTTFVTKYCTIVDGIFRIHKSRLSEQTDHELCLNRCTLSFPEERTRDIQFALIDAQAGTIFIRGNNIYSMGRLLNTLAKYVEIKGSSQFLFTSGGSGASTPLSKHRQSSMSSSQPHIYSDVDGSTVNIANGQTNEVYTPTSVKSVPTPQSSTPIIKATIYHNASKLHDDEGDDDRKFVLPTRRSTNNTNGTSIQQTATATNETYDKPKSFDNVAVMSTPVDRNNNHVIVPPQRRDRSKNEDENNHAESRSPRSNTLSSHRTKSKSAHTTTPNDPSSSPENTVFCLRSSDGSATQHRNSRRRINPIPYRSPSRTTPTDYVNKFTNLFTKTFSTPTPIRQTLSSNDNHISTQTYNTVSTSPSSPSRANTNHILPSVTSDGVGFAFREQPMSKCLYDIPITIERPTKCIVTPFEQFQKPIVRTSLSAEPIASFQSNKQQEEEEAEMLYSQGYDNLAKNDGIGKFRFVIPFNHSPTSAFISSNSTIKSRAPSFSNVRQTSPNKNSNLNNNNNSNTRSTLMTAV